MAVPESLVLDFPLIIVKPNLLDITKANLPIQHLPHLHQTQHNMDALKNKLSGGSSQQPAAGAAPAGQKDDYVDKGELILPDCFPS